MYMKWVEKTAAVAVYGAYWSHHTQTYTGNISYVIHVCKHLHTSHFGEHLESLKMIEV